jgi:type I restriction enzyme S subunit
MGKMKDSGIEWIGEIPEEWDVNRLRYVCALKTGGTPADKIGINDDENGSPWITAPDMDESYKIKKYSQYITQDAINLCKYKLFPPKSILLVCIASVGKLGMIEDYCYSNQQITALMPNRKVFPEFLLYYIQSICHKIVEDASSSVVPIINSTYLKDIKVVMPILQEQQLIAEFLDDKVGKIDDILSDLRKQVETLQKYNKSVITKAVTKGLNPNVKMKDSGIDWIGEISKEAKIIKLKYFSYMKGRIGWQGLKSEDFIDEGPYCVTGTDFHNGKIDWSTCYHVSEERYNMDTNIHIKIGDLLVTKDGTIGKLARVEELPDKACLNSHLLIIRPLKDMFTNSFLYYVMSSSVFTEYYSLVSTGTTMDSLSQEKMGEFIFPVFEIAEQESIADYLDNKCSKIDELIKDKEAQIEKMEKYKKSLIYEYVTGKKRVKGAV